MPHSPSAPRLPLSPASPPESGVKRQSKSFLPAVRPQAPPSPEPMSVATKRYASAYTDGGHTNEMANHSPNNYMSHSQRPPLNSHNPQTQQTSQQANMLKRPAPQDEEDRPTSKRQKKEDAEGAMDVDSSHTATNHDRQHKPGQNGSGHPKIGFKDDVTAHDATGHSKADLDSSIFKDVGPSFRIGKPTHNRANVDVNKHMLGSFGLHPLLSQVARFDPVTGEKINKLRKSYEGQIKNAHLPGKTKAYQEPRDVANNEPSKLRLMGTMSEEDFKAKRTERRIGDLSGLQDVMRKALRINPGQMPDKTQKVWDEILGHEPKAASQPSHGHASYSQTQSSRVPNGIRTAPNAAAAAAAAAAASGKMTTRGRKRGYGDDSYQGYGGFADGFSDPEGDHDRDHDYAERGGKKRRKD